MTSLLRRAIGRSARHAMGQAVARLAHSVRLPDLPQDDQRIVADLARFGAHMTSLEALAASGIPGSDRLLDVAWQATERLRAVAAGQVTPLHAEEDEILAARELPLWGLGTRLLDIAEAYIGLPVFYRGMTIRRDLADGRQVGTRYWHKDSEDTRILKIIVYLNDVAEDGGPFCYLPKGTSQDIVLPVFDGNRVQDADVASRVSAEMEIRSVGKRGTVMFVDTCTILHKGAVPTGTDRMTLFYAYNSTRPREPQHCEPLQSPAALAALANLTQRQQAALNFAG